MTTRLLTWDLDGRPVVLPAYLAPALKVPLVGDLVRAVWVLWRAQPGACLILWGGTRYAILACVLNSFFGTRERLLLADAFMPDNRSVAYGRSLSRVRWWIARRMVLGASLTAVFSERQIEKQSQFLNVSSHRFASVAFKSNHSKRPPLMQPAGSYIFSGGDSRRDYRTLFEAVRGTGIPVIVSLLHPEAYAEVDVPENVILLTAREPAFARLMAGSRFVVIAILPEPVRGAGEGSVCDAMWHGRPVICADDTSACEYIEDGVTGWTTPPADAARLRSSIVALWNDPEAVTRMGRAAHRLVDDRYRHDLFVRRVGALAAAIDGHARGPANVVHQE